MPQVFEAVHLKYFNAVPKISAVHLKIYPWLHKCSQSQKYTLSPILLEQEVEFAMFFFL